jgi:hypothetical protein
VCVAFANQYFLETVGIFDVPSWVPLFFYFSSAPINIVQFIYLTALEARVNLGYEQGHIIRSAGSYAV